MIVVNAAEDRRRTLELGRQGENGVRQVVFDLGRWQRALGPGTAVLAARRAGEQTPYPVPLDQQDGAACWTVTAGDTGRAGYGSVQLTYLVGEQVAKTAVYRTFVAGSLGAAEDQGTPERPYLDRVLLAGEQAQSAAAAAEKARQAVEDLGVSAEPLEAGAAPTVRKTVDPAGAVELHFGLPAGGASSGAAAPADLGCTFLVCDAPANKGLKRAKGPGEEHVAAGSVLTVQFTNGNTVTEGYMLVVGDCLGTVYTRDNCNYGSILAVPAGGFATFQYIGGKYVQLGERTPDTAVSDTSENAVSSKAVKTYVDGLVGVIDQLVGGGI